MAASDEAEGAAVRAELRRAIPKIFDVIVAEVGMKTLKKSMLNQKRKFNFSTQFSGYATADKALIAVGKQARRRGLRREP